MARECGMVVDPVTGTVRPALPSTALRNDWHNVAVLRQALQRVLAQANTVDRQLATAMDRADDVVYVPPGAWPIPIPPPDAGDEQVHQWWTSLSQKDRERLIAEHASALGNLNGIPAAARDTINQQVLTDAEVVGRDGLDAHDHSHYYDMGSESLRSMTYIATGESAESVTKVMPLNRIRFTAAIPGITVALGGCSMPHHEESTTTPPPGPAETQSDTTR